MMLIMLVEALGYSWNIGCSHCGPLLQRKKRDKKCAAYKGTNIRKRLFGSHKTYKQKKIMSAQKFADNPTVRHPTPNTKLLRQHAWRQQRVAQRTRSKEVEEFFYPQPQTKEESQQWLIHFLLREFNEDPIDPWNTSSVTNMYDWEAVVFNQPISQWQIKLATSCK